MARASEAVKKWLNSRGDAETQSFEINNCLVFFVLSAALRLCARCFRSCGNSFTASPTREGVTPTWSRHTVAFPVYCLPTTVYRRNLLIHGRDGHTTTGHVARASRPSWSKGRDGLATPLHRRDGHATLPVPSTDNCLPPSGLPPTVYRLVLFDHRLSTIDRFSHCQQHQRRAGLGAPGGFREVLRIERFKAGAGERRVPPLGIPAIP